VAGCGGGHAPGVASVASATTSATTATQGGLVVYAECMRSHGVPSFPGPDSTGAIPKTQVIAAAQANPTKFNVASNACSDLMPNGGLAPPQTAQELRTKLADKLSFARCMRSHGVNTFPDPTSQGRLTIPMVEAQGIDMHSPAVLHAVQACIPASHGWLTPAGVNQAIHDAGGATTPGG
jgi:hypothetical protein